MAATTTVGVMNAASYSAMSFTPSITGSGANAMNTNAAGGVGANVGGLAALVFGAAALL